MSNVDIKQSIVLDADPSGLLVDIIADVLGLETETREGQGSGGLELGGIGGITLLAADLVVVAEVRLVGNERLAGKADVVNDEIDILGLCAGRVSQRTSWIARPSPMALTVNSTRGKGMAWRAPNKRGTKT